jgi:methyltransferase (TIGR00027 family)
MEVDRHSWTAVMAAAIRAYHAAEPGPRIFEDTLADLLLTRDERQTYERVVSESLRRLDPALADKYSDPTGIMYHGMRAGAGPALILSRARYVEEALGRAVDGGVQQYVIVGAGLDTFALRWREPADRLQVFEIDHPATQAFKRERLRHASLAEPAHLHFVPADLERESVSDALARTAHEPTRTSFFAWPGVTMYLTRDAIMATLRSVRSASSIGSELVFDYFEPQAFAVDAPLRVRSTVQRAGQQGEPMLSGFDSSRLPSDLKSVGFRLVEDLGPSEIQGSLLNGADGFCAGEYWHLARAVAEQP